MDIRELKYFLAIAKEENLTKAAERLYITQPSLTRQMQNLEKEIGCQLFKRGSRKITLTDTGLLLRKRAEEIIELYDKTLLELSAPNAICGTVNIGCGESYSFKLISDTAKNLREIYPEIKFNIHSGNTDDICEKLDKGLFDFGLLVEPVNLSKYDYLRLPYADQWGLLIKKTSQLSKKEYVEPSDISNSPLIFSKHAYFKNPITDWFQKDLDSLNVVATYNLLYNASLMVESEIGYAVCLDNIIKEGISGSLCFKPFLPKIESNIDLVWKKNQVFSNASRIFLDCLKQQIQS